jgi:hypothetical protein
MAKEPVISYGGRKRSISVFVGLVLTGVILTCIVFPKIVFTGQSIVPLQMTIEANLSENPALSELQTQHDTSQEEQLIESLMQDVVISAKAEPKEGWQYVQMRVTGYCTCSQCCGSFRMVLQPTTIIFSRETHLSRLTNRIDLERKW